MSNLPQSYYVKLVESFFKHADYQDKFKMAITIEKEVMKVVEYNQALRDAKLNIITNTLMKDDL